MTFKTEDIVRDEAKISLGFDKQEKDVKQGTGQITTFNQLGFNGIVDSQMVGICQMMLVSLRLF